MRESRQVFTNTFQPTSFPRRRESRRAREEFLDSRLRGNDVLEQGKIQGHVDQVMRETVNSGDTILISDSPGVSLRHPVALEGSKATNT